MFEYENKYKNQGVIAGIDEAGRGPLAGPVVCACVVMPLEKENLIDGINDSKKLSAKKRDILFDQIVEKATDYAVVEIDEDTIVAELEKLVDSGMSKKDASKVLAEKYNIKKNYVYNLSIK